MYGGFSFEFVEFGFFLAGWEIVITFVKEHIMKYYSTKQAAQVLNVPPYRLQRIVWEGRIPSPEKLAENHEQPPINVW